MLHRKVYARSHYLCVFNFYINEGVLLSQSSNTWKQIATVLFERSFIPQLKFYIQEITRLGDMNKVPISSKPGILVLAENPCLAFGQKIIVQLVTRHKFRSIKTP